MNNKDLMLRRSGNWRKFHTPGMPNYAKRKRNAVFISPSNSLEHEKAKLEVCWNLRKQGKDFITEAVCNRTNLRHDVVDLDGDIYEIETTKKRAERFIEVQKNYDVNIIVVKLWEKHQESAPKTA